MTKERFIDLINDNLKSNHPNKCHNFSCSSCHEFFGSQCDIQNAFSLPKRHEFLKNALDKEMIKKNLENW